MLFLISVLLYIVLVNCKICSILNCRVGGRENFFHCAKCGMRL